MMRMLIPDVYAFTFLSHKQAELCDSPCFRMSNDESNKGNLNGALRKYFFIGM